MSYEYEKERERLFTDEGQRLFLKIRDRVACLLADAGAFTMEKATRGNTGDSWQMIACVDRMVELGEIAQVGLAPRGWGQDRVFASARDT